MANTPKGAAEKYAGRQAQAPADAVPVLIYRSPAITNMYLYVAADAELDSVVPEELLERFGTPEPVTQLDLWPARPLARVSAADVLQALQKAGFFLQLPPPEIDSGR